MKLYTRQEHIKDETRRPDEWQLLIPVNSDQIHSCPTLSSGTSAIRGAPHLRREQTEALHEATFTGTRSAGSMGGIWGMSHIREGPGRRLHRGGSGGKYQTGVSPTSAQTSTGEVLEDCTTAGKELGAGQGRILGTPSEGRTLRKEDPRDKPCQGMISKDGLTVTGPERCIFGATLDMSRVACMQMKTIKNCSARSIRCETSPLDARTCVCIQLCTVTE